MSPLGQTAGDESAAASANLPNQVPSFVAQSLPTSQYPQNWNAETYNAWMQQYYSHAQQPQRSMVSEMTVL